MNASLRPFSRFVLVLAVMFPLLANPRLASAYVGPPVIVDSEGPGKTPNANLMAAWDESPSSAAVLGYCSALGCAGGWVVYRYADGIPRLVTGISWSAGNYTQPPGLVLLDPDGHVVEALRLEYTGSYTFAEPVLVLSYSLQAYGSNSTYIYDLQPRIVELDPPGVPAGLTAAEVSHNRVRLVWTPPADGGPVSGYRVYRDGAHVADVDSTTYLDVDVLPLTEYVYEVAAVGIGGESPRTPPLTVMTPEEPVIPPPEPPTALEVTPTVAGLRLSWSPSKSVDVVGYRVYVDGDLVIETTVTTVSLAELESGRAYLVAVTAVTDDGRESAAVTATGTPLDVPQEPPGPVQAARARVGPRLVHLTWHPPVTGGMATEYLVYRDGDLLGSTADTSWRDATVEAETEYLYAIVAANPLGVSDPVEVPVRTPAPGLLEGASPGLPGLGREVGSGIGLLLQPWLVAAGFILARLILTRGLRWVGVWRRG